MKHFSAQPAGDSGLAVIHFQHIDCADDDVLAPEQEHERENLPVEDEHAENRHEIGEQQRQHGRPQPVGS